jgi:hypothetical protein
MTTEVQPATVLRAIELGLAELVADGSCAPGQRFDAVVYAVDGRVVRATLAAGVVRREAA